MAERTFSIILGGDVAQASCHLDWLNNVTHPTANDRLVMLGSLLADLLDRTLGLWPVPEIFRPTSRMFAHTLLFAVLLLDFT